MISSGFDTAACSAALGANASDFQLDNRVECDSTNSQLMHRAAEGARSGTVLIAARQTAGRGRLGRTWISSPQQSLTFSLLWRFAPDSSAPEALSLVVGLGLQRALAVAGIKALVKWPNDILCEGRKLAGVLIETQPGDMKSAVIGVGINLALPPDLPVDIASLAIGLDELLPAMPEREPLLALLLSHLAGILRRYETDGFVALRDEWQARHAYQGCNVRINGGAENIAGVCSGINDQGELLVNTKQGIRRVISGDVTLRLA